MMWKSMFGEISKHPEWVFALLVILVLVVLVLVVILAVLGKSKAVDNATLKAYLKSKMGKASSTFYSDRARINDSTGNAGEKSNFIVGRTEQPMVSSTDKYMEGVIRQQSKGMTGSSSYDNSDDGNNSSDLGKMGTSGMTDKFLLKRDAPLVA